MFMLGSTDFESKDYPHALHKGLYVNKRKIIRYAKFTSTKRVFILGKEMGNAKNSGENLFFFFFFSFSFQLETRSNVPEQRPRGRENRTEKSGRI